MKVTQKEDKTSTQNILKYHFISIFDGIISGQKEKEI